MNERWNALNSRLWILGLCLFLFAWPAATQAQSGPATQLSFPHFVFNAEANSRIALFNPQPGSVSVTLTYRDREGLLTSRVVDPLTLTIPAHGLISRTADELFGSSAVLDGTLVITSSAPGIIGQCLNFDSATTYLEETEDVDAALSLVFPVIPGSAEGISAIDLYNPNTRETSVELRLCSLDGKVLSVATVRVPAGGAYRNLTHEIFPAGTDFRNVSHILAISKMRNVLSVAQTVAGDVLFTGFSSSASWDGYVDLAALSALPLSQVTNSGVIPYFRTGAPHASTLALVNLETASAYVTVTAIANNGASLSTRMILVAAQGGVRAPLQSLLPELGARDSEGWLLVQSSGRVTGAVLYGRSDSSALTAVPLQRTAKTEFVIPQVFQGDGLSTDLTLVNPTPVTCTIDLRIIAADGSTAAAAQTTLGPSKRTTLSLKTLLPELGETWSRTLHVKSSGGLFANALVGDEAGAVLANVTPKDANFPDASLTSFAVSGKVSLNDLPAVGFTMTLSGKSGKTATTDAEGFYLFTNLPPGNYSLSVEQSGFQFIPAQVDFELTNTSKKQDFQGFTAPDAILVQPDSMPIGVLDNKITIFGRDFNSTSEAFLGMTRLATTFVDGTKLEAIVPSYLTLTAARFQITVITNGSDVSRRVSRPFPFIVYQDRPSLVSITTGGNIVEGSPGASLTIQGSGFLEGAQIRVNGISDGIQVTFVSESQLVATLPASYFEQGGVYPVTVENSYPAHAVSNVLLLTVYYPPPAMENVVPGSCAAKLESDASPLNIEVIGYGFRRGAVIIFDDKPLITTYCETDAYCMDTHLYAQVPATLLRMSGFAKIEVRNPNPSLAPSEAMYLRIDGLRPSITAVLPGAATLTTVPGDFAMPIIVDGTNFGAQTYVMVGRVGGDKEEGKAEVLSSTRLIATVTVGYPDSLGEWQVMVGNPPPGGGESDPVSFFITEASFVAAPFLTSLSPGTVSPGSRSFTLTVNGSNFKSGTVINFRTTPLVTTFVSKTQVRATVPASLIRTAGKIPISVTNPDTSGTSNKLFLDVR